MHSLQLIHQKIEQVCRKAGRNSQDIALLAATKYATPEQINQAISAGIKIIGENRVQDAQKKFPELLPAKKHFIGHLQSNKVKTAVTLFDMIESVDSLSLAAKIDEVCTRLNKKMPILVEINIANDPKKNGIPAVQTFDFLKSLKFYRNLQIKGLMTIVPYLDDLEQVRLLFRKMKALFDLCRKSYRSLDTLSMGMSHDFEVAIEEGATEVRIGSLLFKGN